MAFATAETEARRIAFVLAAIVLLLALLDMAGWWLHIALLTSVFPGYATMKPNTSACLGLIALAMLLLDSSAAPPRWQRVAGMSAVAIAAVISLLTVLEYLSGHNFGIDLLLAPVAMDKFGGPQGRMSIASAACLASTSVALLLRDRWHRVSTTLVLAGLIVSVSGIAGFVFQAGPLMAVPWLRSLAIHTAFALACLQFAMLASRPEREPFYSLSQYRRVEGRRRQLLLALTALPLVVALPVSLGLKAGAYDAPFALSLVLVLLMILQTALLWLDNRALRQIEAKLIQSEKLAAVGRLASSIAHEINNPLESVTNLLYLARQSCQDEETQQYLDSADLELRRASAITSQTLRFHKQSTRARPTDAVELVRNALLMFQGKLVNSRVQVETRFRADKPLLCFEGEIRQVLNNLIRNAIDAMPTGGRLLLRTRQAQDRSGANGVIVTIADTGGGISSAAKARIYEPFFTTKGHSGNGLGLWISREIVGRHQGYLRMRSRQKASESGTVFEVFLPCDPEIVAASELAGAGRKR